MESTPARTGVQSAAAKSPRATHSGEDSSALDADRTAATCAIARSLNRRRSAWPMKPPAPVEVLKVQEKLRIETAGDFDGFAPYQHEGAAHHRHRRHDFVADGV